MFIWLFKKHTDVWVLSFKPSSHIQCRKTLLNSCTCLWARPTYAIHTSCYWSSALCGLLEQTCYIAISTAQSRHMQQYESPCFDRASSGAIAIQLGAKFSEEKHSLGWQSWGVLQCWNFPRPLQCTYCHYWRQHLVFPKAYKEYYYSA